MKYTFGIALIALSMACSNKETAPPEEKQVLVENRVELTEAQRKLVEISTTQISQSLLNASIHVNGRIDVPPQNLVSISLPLGGYLRQTELLPGMQIRKGQQIGIIEDERFIQLQQDYLLAKSKLHFATLEYNRQRVLNEGQASSSKVMQQAQSEMQSERILLSGLEEKLRLLQLNPNTIRSNQIQRKIPIFSPIQGFVTKVNGNVGKYFSPSEVVFEIINPDDVHLNLKVYEKDLPLISIGSPVQTYTNSSPQQKFPASIILIGQDLAADGSSEVHCHFKKYPAHLAPGTYMNADIETGTHAVSILPNDCLVSFEGKEYVFVQWKTNSYEMVEVQTGKQEGNQIEIVHPEPLLGKTIVVKGSYTLLMKLKNKEE